MANIEVCNLTAFYEALCSSGILGKVLHPGGLILTRRAVEMAGVHRGARVLDVASGAGGTAKFLAEEYECEVVGLDVSRYMTTCANAEVKEAGLRNIGFVRADSETIPFRSESFDFAISECSLCLFPNKVVSLAEMTRTVKRGGRLIVTDVTLSRNAQPPDDPLLRYACIAGAEDISSYIQMLYTAGLHNVQTEDCSEELANTIKNMFEQQPELRRIIDSLPESTINSDKGGFLNLLALGRRFLRERTIGYAIMVGTK